MVVHTNEILEKYFLSKILRPRTQDAYRQVVTRFSHQMDKQGVTSLEQVTPELLEKWRAWEIQENQLSPISWNSYCRTLRAIFGHAVERNLVPWESNYFKGLMLQPPIKRKKTLTPQQISQTNELLTSLAMNEEANEYSGRIHPVWFWRTVMETFYYTGIRRNQLLHIRVEDVCLESRAIFLRLDGSKTHREHIVPIPTSLLPSMERLKGQARKHDFKLGDQLFNVTRFGVNRYRKKEMQDANISNCYRELTERLGFPITPHRFRHTLATALMRKSPNNLKTVQSILGHTSLKTTLEYVEVDFSDMQSLLDAVPILSK